MKTSRYSDSQILSILKQAESGTRPQSSLGLPGIRHQRDLLVLPADTVGRKCGQARHPNRVYPAGQTAAKCLRRALQPHGTIQLAKPMPV